MEKGMKVEKTTKRGRNVEIERESLVACSNTMKCPLCAWTHIDAPKRLGLLGVRVERVNALGHLEFCNVFIPLRAPPGHY